MNKVCTHNSFKINKVFRGWSFRDSGDFPVIESFEKSTLEVKLWAGFVEREL